MLDPNRPDLAPYAGFVVARTLGRRADLLTSVGSPAAVPFGLADAVKRELTRRVRRRLTKAFVRNMAERVVAKAIDRVVREELARMNVHPPGAK